MSAADPGSARLPPGYRPVRALGSGGFGTVWLAEHEHLKRLVAVKVLDGALDDDAQRRFGRECATLGRLSRHPHVVTVHDAGVDESGRAFIVMEAVEGGSVEDQLAARGPLPVDRVLQIGAQVADALAAAHAAGILHRDVKPANVLLDAQGEALLVDFGIALADDLPRTGTGTVVGTIACTAPEVLEGRPFTPAADLWSLGVTIESMLLGQNPFSRPEDETAVSSIARILAGDRLPVTRDVPSELGDLVDQLLRRDPVERPASAQEVRDRIQAWGDDRRGMPDSGTVVAPPPDPPSGLGSPAEASPLPGRRVRHLGLALGAAVLVGLVAAVGLIVLRSPGGPDLCEVAATRTTPGDVVRVYLEVGATSADFDRIGRELQALDPVAVELVDQEAAYEEAMVLFADSPDTLELLRPEDVPGSFVLTLGASTETDADAIAAEAAAISGVLEADVSSERPTAVAVVDSIEEGSAPRLGGNHDVEVFADLVDAVPGASREDAAVVRDVVAARSEAQPDEAEQGAARGLARSIAAECPS